jgi:hypothetical protein
VAAAVAAVAAVAEAGPEVVAAGEKLMALTGDVVLPCTLAGDGVAAVVVVAVEGIGTTDAEEEGVACAAEVECDVVDEVASGHGDDTWEHFPYTRIR